MTRSPDVSAPLRWLGWLAGLLLLTACAGPDPEALCDGGPCGGGEETPCREGQRRCLDNQPQTCIAEGVWGAPRLCDGTCVNGSCQIGCDADSCVPGETRCALGDIQTCERREDGCGVWGPSTVCPEGEACAAGQCQTDCSAPCQPGDRRCVSPSALSVCEAGAGCPRFGPASECGAGTVCSDGQCRPPEACLDGCPDDGRIICLDAANAQTCVLGAAGCREWSAPMPCAAGEACVAGTGCTAACQDACSAGEVRCQQGGLQRCAVGPAGCLAWGAIEACDAQESCQDGRCVNSCPEACPMGARRCSPGRQVCEAQGGCPTWIDDPCPGAAACVGAGQCGDCAPGDTEDEACGNCGVRRRTCDASGRWGAFGACSGEGECRPDEQSACGNCGRRTCNARCQWGPCGGEGVCAPGSLGDCGQCGQRSCDAQCSWGACNNGDGTTFRRCNDCGWQFCCPNGNWCDCAPRYACGGNQSCVGAGICR